MAQVFNFTADVTTWLKANASKVSLINGKRRVDGSDFTLLEYTEKSTGLIKTIGFGNSIANPNDVKSWKSDAYISEVVNEGTSEVGLVIHLRTRQETDITDLLM